MGLLMSPLSTDVEGVVAKRPGNVRKKDIRRKEAGTNNFSLKNMSVE
jgi:hypothetical protein